MGGGDVPVNGSSAAGGPPAADAMFEAFLNDGLDDLVEEDKNAVEARSEDVLAAGLHFFERMKGA